LPDSDAGKVEIAAAWRGGGRKGRRIEGGGCGRCRADESEASIVLQGDFAAADGGDFSEEVLEGVDGAGRLAGSRKGDGGEGAGLFEVEAEAAGGSKGLVEIELDAERGVFAAGKDETLTGEACHLGKVNRELALRTARKIADRKGVAADDGGSGTVEPNPGRRIGYKDVELCEGASGHLERADAGRIALQTSELKGGGGGEQVHVRAGGGR